MTGIRLVRISWYGAGDIPSFSYRRPATGLSTSTHTHRVPVLKVSTLCALPGIVWIAKRDGCMASQELTLPPTARLPPPLRPAPGNRM